MRQFLLSISLICLSGVPSPAQQPVNPRFTYHRAICVVPLVGTGNPGDPIRAKHMPAPGAAAATGSASGAKAGSGIIAAYSELSDDGKWALAEFVAADRTALLPILEDTSEGVWAVEKGRVPLQTIEAELRKFKKSIDMQHFGAVVR